MSVLDYVLPFLLALGILIVVHEFGHYLVARLCGVRVLRFSLGFGKPLLVWRAGADKTEWVLAMFPLGGPCIPMSCIGHSTGRVCGAELPSWPRGQLPTSCWPSRFTGACT